MGGHSAADSASGYLYQVRYALYAALSRQKSEPGLSVSIETYDDVAFDDGGSPKERIQTKHTRTAKTLSDYAVEFWKTFGIWLDVVKDRPEELGRTKLILVSTAKVAEGSGLSFLRPEGRGRNIDKALPPLLKVAKDAKNEALADVFAAFENTESALRSALLDMIVVLDASPNIVDVHGQIRHLLRHAVTEQQMDAFLERLEGWWFTVAILALAGVVKASIPVSIIDAKVQELREQFGPDKLPVDYAFDDPSEELVAVLDSRPFVEQLRLVRVGPRRIRAAITEYFRAFRQRSRWTREQLLMDGELLKFNKRLADAWNKRFGKAEELLGKGATEDELVKAGVEVYDWACDQNYPLRGVSEPFWTQGSFQMLANRKKVGWHPEFDNRIQLKTDQGDDDDDPALA